MVRRIGIAQLILITGLTILIFIALCIHEGGDMNVVIFGTSLYFPYAFLLTLYNGITTRILNLLNKIIPAINYLIPVIPVIIWFFLSNQQIVIRFWKIQVNGFLWIIGMMILANSIELWIKKRSLALTKSSCKASEIESES